MTMAFSSGEYRKLYENTKDERYMARAILLDEWSREQDFDFPEHDETEPDIEQPFRKVRSELARVSFEDATLHQTEVLNASAIDNIETLNATFIELLEPLVTGVQTKVQHATTLRSSRILGHHEWYAELLMESQKSKIFYDVPYHSYKDFNKAEGLKVIVTRREKPHRRDLSIEFSFKNDGVESIEIDVPFTYMSDPYSEAPKNLKLLFNTRPESMRVGPNSNGAWDEGILNDWAARIKSNHKFYFQRNPVQIISEIGKRGYRGSSVIVRTYNPSTNNFDTQRSDKNFSEVGRAMSVDAITDFIAGLLKPIVKDEKVL